jgi:prevent-host-death family protein
MIQLQSSKVRTEFSETLNLVAYQGERVVLERHGKRVAALVPIQDLDVLEATAQGRLSEEIVKQN